MEIIIKISSLYGISFIIAMFVAFVIWAVYEIMSNPKLLKRLIGAKKSGAANETNNSKG